MFIKHCKKCRFDKLTSQLLRLHRLAAYRARVCTCSPVQRTRLVANSNDARLLWNAVFAFGDVVQALSDRKPPLFVIFVQTLQRLWLHVISWTLEHRFECEQRTIDTRRREDHAIEMVDGSRH